MHLINVIKNVKGVKVLNYDDENLRLISDKDIISYSRTQNVRLQN